MKTKLILFAVAVIVTSPAHAAYNYFTTVASQSTLGATCDSDSTNPGIIYKCDCEMSAEFIGKTCSKYSTIPCVLSGTVSGSTDYRVCSYKSLSANPCQACNCKTSTGSWQTAGNHVVRQLRVSTTAGQYSCSANSSYYYGCSAGYYQYTGSGSGIVCADCPSSGGVPGTNAEGTTDITTCYIPANTKLTDDTGRFVYTGNCYYTK